MLVRARNISGAMRAFVIERAVAADEEKQRVVVRNLGP